MHLDFLKSELESGNFDQQDQVTATADMEDAQQVAEQILGDAKEARESAEAQHRMMDVLRAEHERIRAGAPSTSRDAMAADAGASTEQRKRKEPTVTAAVEADNNGKCQVG